MVEIGITPKIIVKRKRYEETHLGCDCTKALSYDEDLIVLGYLDGAAVEHDIKRLEEEGLKLEEDFTVSEMGMLYHPVDWLCYPDQEHKPCEIEMRE